MFRARSNPPGVRRLRPSEESRLRAELARNHAENAYLLGLLADYSLRGLGEMGWGAFYWFESPGGIEGIFYGDATGLVVLTESSQSALARFADYCLQKEVAVKRIIAAREPARLLHQFLHAKSPEGKNFQRWFEEVGMILTPERLEVCTEPRLRGAVPSEAMQVAQGAAEAMLEELHVETAEDEFQRLVRSKADLIDKGRYYVLEESGSILFQAYLSASLSEVGQIQGVWVPPEHRGRGLATRCLGEMCKRCFLTHGALVLSVQKRNLPALAVYRKLGFAPFQDRVSIWY